MKRFAVPMLLLAAMALPVLAQPATQPTTDAVTSENYLLTISLHHQRLDDVIEYIEKVSGANIILSDGGLPKTELPMIDSLELRDVGIAQAIETLVELLKPRVVLAKSIQRDPRSFQSNERGVFILKLQDSGDSTAPGQKEPMTVAVYNLSHLGGTTTAQPFQRVKDVLSLIDTTLTATDGPKPMIQYHEPTQTLIVKGTEAQHAAVDQILESQAPVQATQGNGQQYYQPNIASMQVGSLNEDQLKQAQESLTQELAQVKALRNSLSRATTQP